MVGARCLAFVVAEGFVTAERVPKLIVVCLFAQETGETIGAMVEDGEGRRDGVGSEEPAGLAKARSYRS